MKYLGLILTLIAALGSAMIGWGFGTLVFALVFAGLWGAISKQRALSSTRSERLHR